jgi:branched-chain amino acid transport system substrate-binding protein
MNILKGLFAALAACAVLLPSCLPVQAAQAAGGNVRIGVMCPLTGPWASEGIDMRRIVSLLADTLNKSGGLAAGPFKGRAIELVVEDDAGDPRTAALAAQKLATANVLAVIGTYGSAVTEASQNIIDEAGIVQIGTGSTSVRLTEKGLPLFFRTCPRDDAQGRVAALMLKKLGAKSVAVLHDNSSYAKGLAEEARAILDREGVRIAFFDAITPKERDYNATLTRMKSSAPDMIFFSGYYNDAATLLRQKMEMGWNVPMLGGDATNNTDLVKIAGKEAAKGFYFVSPPVPQDFDTPDAKAFMESYRKAHDQMPSSVWSVLAGDAFKVIVAALEAGADKPEAIAAKLRKDVKDFPGLTGALSFDAKGDRIGDLYRLYVVTPDGEFILAK